MLTTRLTAQGLDPAIATAVVGDANLGLTAAGSGQSTALQLVSPVNIFSTVAASTGALLPLGASPGDRVQVYNGGANNLTVYPQSGALMNGTANAGVTVAPATMLSFMCNDKAQGWSTPILVPTNAVNATNATNIGTTAVTTNASFFPLFVASSAGGNQAADLASALTYNPSTGVWTAPALQETAGWTSYVPTITAGVGTFTTVSATGRYRQIGKTVNFKLQIVITTNGTAATSISATLPVAANSTNPSVVVGRCAAVSGKMVQGLINTSATTVVLLTYDNLYPGATGESVDVSGNYESA